MTAPTLSAYPAAVEALIPQARTLADQLGVIPSRNRLMKEFRVGAPKAIALREALTTTPDTTGPDPGVPATQVAEWAGHSVHVLLKVYAKCIDGQDEAARRRIADALDEDDDDGAE